MSILALAVLLAVRHARNDAMWREMAELNYQELIARDMG
jgi:hypothetical protein